ncbi:hypothetical protein Marme_4180 [Marinomonas mediterranea MMB-1]|jgi:hypothetical protein|uniref:Uncharacterized protein n=1 Tax=Marinomonas mediterranea (strain ATCC 700492 / JCM 21426 / NBRC 103028 / MMB-1) TaxID=717774 RepID=F2K1P5_MARM1|nr:hypothetical protein Marme_4180 [Marinomonas mediterranea MMB-1]
MVLESAIIVQRSLQKDNRLIDLFPRSRIAFQVPLHLNFLIINPQKQKQL